MAAAAVVAVVAFGYAFTRPNVGSNRESISPTASQSPPGLAAPSASPLPDLSETFTSAIHGYSISYPAGWTVRPATEPWLTGFPAADDQAYESENDHFASYLNDTINDTLTVTSQAIPDGSTFDDWLSGYVLSICGDPRPAGCGFPRSPINIGGQGGVRMGANSVEERIMVAVDGRVYVFTAQTQFNSLRGGGIEGDPHSYLPPDLFLAMLETVQFDPASAVQAP